MGGISIVKIHIVQKGDTLWKISKKYGIDFEQLKKANQQLVNHDMIMPGMKINIPSSGITKSAKQTNKEYPVKKEMPVKEAQIKEKPKEMKKPLVPPKPPAVPTPPEPMPPPKAEPQPSYHTQQAKMNVNFYHQPSYPKVQTPPAPKAVKEKPKPKPKEMVKPKAVEKIPVKKPIPPKPIKKMPPPKPVPIQKKPMAPQMPVYQQVGPVMEGCIPLSALCGYGCQPMYPNNTVYPQPYGLYQQPNHHHPSHSFMHHTQQNMYYPEPFNYTNQYQQPYWQGNQREMNPPEEKEDEFRNNTEQGYGDVTTNNYQKGTYVYPPQTEYEGYDGMVPWTYPIRQAGNNKSNDNEGN